jgi:hypothetical protein
MPTLVQEFTGVFRMEHRHVRGPLPDLVEAFGLRVRDRDV